MVMLAQKLLCTETDFNCCFKEFLVIVIFLDLHLILKWQILEAVRYSSENLSNA